jgi:hypothetical protein
MSDLGDAFGSLRNHKRTLKELYGVPCPKCNELQPKRMPTNLMPGQRCKVDGYRDPRTPLTNEQMGYE